MIASKLVGFDAAKIKEQMFKNASEEQTRRLVEYAKTEIKKIGDKIKTYNGANHLDRTGNLLNSLCWIVTYGDSVKDCGFYRTPRNNIRFNRWAQVRGLGPDGGSDSYLHEWNNPVGEQVDGYQRAMDFIDSYQGVQNKWTVAFAILAPYWGYWETGFTMRGGGSVVYQEYGDQKRKIPRSSKFYQFRVMTHVYDEVSRDLRPAKMHISVHVPKYSYKARSEKGRKYKNRRFTKKLGKIE